jgi:DDE superfamily endonuclease/Tc5 transposase DNA-binding domain/Fission yeast centromere protein N-terminal domain
MVHLTGEERKKIRRWVSLQTPRPTYATIRKHILVAHKKNVGVGTINRTMGPKYDDLDQMDAASPELQRKTAHGCQYPLLEEFLRQWQLELEDQGLGTSGELIQSKAVKIWRSFPEVRGGKPEEPVPTFGKTWVELYKQRQGLRRRTFHGVAASVSITTAATELFSQVREEVARVPVGNRYNMDETGLFWRMAPSASLATRNRPGVKKDKSRVTLAMTSNDTGDDRFPIWVIGKAMKPRALANFPFQTNGLVWKSNRKAWMTGDIMRQWLTAFYAHIAATKPGQKVILLLDNFAGHSTGVDFAPPPDNITVRFLPPGTTSVWQPMDQGIISAFKAFYRKAFMHWYGEREGSPNWVKEITLRDAMIWASGAWYASVSAATIRNCWRKSTLVEVGQGEEITPVSDEVDAARAELRVMYDAAINPDDEGVIDFDRFVELAEKEEPVVERLSESEILDKIVSHWREEMAGEEMGGEQAEPAPPETSPQEALELVKRLVGYAARREKWKLPHLVALHQMQEIIRVEYTDSLHQRTLDEVWGGPSMDVDS